MTALKNKWTFLILIWIISGVFIFTDFLIKPAIWSDEGVMIQLGRNLAEFGKMNVQVAPGVFSSNSHIYTSSTGWVTPFSAALAFKLFGPSFTVARLVSAFYLLAFITIVFLILNRLRGLKLAVFGTLLMISFAPLYGNGKSVLSEIPAFFWLAFGIYFYEFFREKIQLAPLEKKFLTGQALFSGLGFGMFFAAKPSFLLLGLPILFVLHLVYFFRKKIKAKWLVIFWIFIFLAVLPTIYFGLIHPVNFSNLQKTFFYYSNNQNSPCVFCDIKLNLAKFITHSTLWHLEVLLAAGIIYSIIYWRSVVSDWRKSWLTIFSFLILIYFIRSVGVFRYLLFLQLSLLLLLPVFLSGIVEKIKPPLKIFINPLLAILIFIQFIHLMFFATMYYSSAPPQLEKYIKEEIAPKEGTVGIIEAQAAAAIMPSGRYFQFIQFGAARGYGTHGVTDGLNPLASLPDNLLPLYLIYRIPEDRAFPDAIALYFDRFNKFYQETISFRDYRIMKRTINNGK